MTTFVYSGLTRHDWASYIKVNVMLSRHFNMKLTSKSCKDLFGPQIRL